MLVITGVCLLTKKKSISLNQIISFNFPTHFFLGKIFEKSDTIDSREVSFKGNVYNFSVDCNDIDESDVLNILQYLIVKY